MYYFLYCRSQFCKRNTRFYLTVLYRMKSPSIHSLLRSNKLFTHLHLESIISLYTLCILRLALISGLYLATMSRSPTEPLKGHVSHLMFSKLFHFHELLFRSHVIVIRLHEIRFRSHEILYRSTKYDFVPTKYDFVPTKS